jgi:hypothetical protein
MINNLLEYPEYNVFRAVTGSTSVFPNGATGTPTSASFPTKGTIPIARTMTGTIATTDNIVRGTSTLFESEFKIGDFLYNGDKSVRKITKILSDTLMELEAEFVADLAGGTAALKCEPQIFKVIQVENSSANAAELQEAPFAAGSRVILWGAPIAYDALTGTLAFTVSK